MPGEDFLSDLLGEDAVPADQDESDLLARQQGALMLLLKLYGSRASAQNRFFYLQQDVRKIIYAAVERCSQSPQQVGLRKKLPAILARLVEQAQLPYLQKKCTVGVGGQFSAGKSKFLNRITGIDCLPVEQVPTTAVATYLVHTPREVMEGYTVQARKIPLDKNELQLIAHTFLKDYGIGFASILKKIVIGMPEFSREHVTLLDTPGYNPPQDDGNTTKVDGHVALEHLRGCDRLIWLISAEKGTPEQSDIDILSSIQLDKPYLIILNKADKRIDTDIKCIIEEIQNKLKDAGISFCGVTAYSSKEGKEYFGKNLINAFLDEADADGRDKSDALYELDALALEWKQFSLEFQTSLEERERSLWTNIAEINNPIHAASLIQGFHMTRRKKIDICYKADNFLSSIEKIKKWVALYAKK